MVSKAELWLCVLEERQGGKEGENEGGKDLPRVTLGSCLGYVNMDRKNVLLLKAVFIEKNA